MERQDLQAFLFAHFEKLQFIPDGDTLTVKAPAEVLDAVAAWLADRCLDHDDRLDLLCNYMLRLTEEELIGYLLDSMRGKRDPRRDARDYAKRLIETDYREALIQRYLKLQQPDECDLAKQLKGAA